MGWARVYRSPAERSISAHLRSNGGQSPVQRTIGLAGARSDHAEPSRGDSAASFFRPWPGGAAERCPSGSRHALRLCVRRQGDREPPNGHLRRLRIVRDAGAGRLHRPDAQQVSRLSGAGLRGGREHRPRDALLAERLGGRGRYGGRRLRDPLLGSDQRLLRRCRNLGAAHVHPSRHDLGPLLRGAGAAGRVGAGGDGRNPCAHAALARPPAGRAPA